MDNDTIVDQRKNLRERVSRLEALVDTLLEERTERSAAEALRDLRSNNLPPTPLSTYVASETASYKELPGHTDQAPILLLFNNAVVRE